MYQSVLQHSLKVYKQRRLILLMQDWGRSLKIVLQYVAYEDHPAQTLELPKASFVCSLCMDCNGMMTWIKETSKETN